MANTVKRKIRSGTAFLFLLVLLSSGLGIYFMSRLKDDAQEILKDNYESLQYSHQMQAILEQGPLTPAQLASFDSVLNLQRNNVTEPGEQKATQMLSDAFQTYKMQQADSMQSVMPMYTQLREILSLNMASIERKNNNATETANSALTIITFLAAIIFLVGITFSYNFPSIITVPISKLISGIREIGSKNYRHRIHLDRKDEFGEMATAFNEMAERLEYFENSNLNKIIFEKTRAESVINSLKEASIGLDRDGVILFANNQALQMLGMNSSELIGQPVDDIAKRNDLLRFVLNEKNNLPFKVVLDNHENYFTKEVMEVTDGGMKSKVIILRNITSFKELDAAKTNLIATISHELKTPLASSDFSLKLLSDERVSTLNEEQRDLVENLREDNRRMLRILSELLNMSQVEAGRIQLDIAEVDAAQIVQQALSATNNGLREKSLRIVTSLPTSPAFVMADAEKAGWVLNNLLSNAIKHSPGEGLIEVAVHPVGDSVEVTVRDQGMGIPEEYASRVFDRFFKVPGSKAQGTGLGLAISKEFIEAQGGRVWFTSREGEGSVFGFSLPLPPARTS